MPLRATADETAALVAAARTDSERLISYDPERRPEVSSLLLIAALCRSAGPRELAGEIGAGGSAALKAMVTDAINERFASIRRRRKELTSDPGYLRTVLTEGNERAAVIATDTMNTVRHLMHTSY